MEAAVFFMLAFRLPAYQGAMASVVAREQKNGGGGRPGAAKYERNSAQANNARTADVAPAATANSLASLNSQLGSQWFSHRVIKGAGKAPAGE